MVESKSCKDCVSEINQTAEKDFKAIIEHREKCRKCIGCDRLQLVKNAAMSSRGKKM